MTADAAASRPVPPGSDALLLRDRDTILADLLAVRTAWTPDWLPAAGGPGRGLAEIAAWQLELLEERLKRVPDHRLAVLLDMLGASRLPAQGARAHLLLTAPPGSRGSLVPRGTRVGATVPDRDAPVVFETQHDVAIGSAVIVEVHSVLPREDAEADHSADVLGGRAFTLFGDPQAVSRELFIGHDRLLAFDGRAVIELEIGISVAAPRPLALSWSWWDGVQWRPFTDLVASPLAAGDDDSFDGTQGLTRSGTVRLVAPVAASAPLALDGRESHWIRGRLDAPLLLPAGAPLPTLSRVRLSVVNEHRRVRVSRREGATGMVVHWPGRTGSDAAGKVVVHTVDLTDGAGAPTYSPGDPRANPPVPGKLQGGVALPGPYALAAAAGHTVRLGVSPEPSRLTGDTALTRVTPRRVALASDDDLTAPLLVDADTRFEISVAPGLALDKGIADRRAVDLTKTFAPLGPSPDRGTAFLFACETATARPGSRVTLLIERPETAAEHSDRNADLQRDAAATTIVERDAIVARLADTCTHATHSATDRGVKGHLEYARDRLLVIQGYLPDLYRGTALDVGPGGARQSATAWFDTLRTTLAGLVGTARANAQTAKVLTENVEIPANVAGTILGILTGGVASFFLSAADIPALVAINDRLTDAITALDGISAQVVPPLARGTILGREPYDFIQLVIGDLTQVKAHVEEALADLDDAITRLKELNPTTLAVQLAQPETTKLNPPRVAWEYYDGEGWRDLGVTADERVAALLDSGALHFTVPDDISPVDIDGDVRTWLRARLAEGTYARMTLVSWVDMAQDDRPTNFLPVIEPRPPSIDRIEVFYRHESDAVDPTAVKARDVHRWNDLTAAVTWPSTGGTPFTPMDEAAPSLYLGFDAELPADRIGLWVQPESPSPWAPAHRPVWEGWDGRGWARLDAVDATDGLRHEGVVRLLWPGTDAAGGAAVAGALGTEIVLAGRGGALRFAPCDSLVISDLHGQVPVVVAAVGGAGGDVVSVRDPLPRAFAGARLSEAPPARFGVPRTWIRATFDPLRPAPELRLAALAAHAVEVVQSETQRGDVLGSGDGSARQVLTARRFPLAGDPELEVRELDGDRADLDRDVLVRSLRADGVDPASVRIDTDARSGRVTAVWVPWRAVPSLGAAGPVDRVFLVDRAQGRFAFGDGVHGRALPSGRDNVRLRAYATTEGEAGNVAAGALTSLLSAVPVSEARNPLPASGGAGVEPLECALDRAPALLRHRRLALTESDVEAIAREASPAVVRARAHGARDRWGRPQAGAVRVVIVARDGTDRPTPTSAVLALVRQAVTDASPAVARVTVEGPAYRPIGVTVTVIPVASAVAGEVRERVVRRLQEFLHPLRGGPGGSGGPGAPGAPDGRGGDGWDFGEGVHVSDVARVLEDEPDVDAVTGLVLTDDGAPVGDTAAVRDDQLVCAGPLVVRLTGGV